MLHLNDTGGLAMARIINVALVAVGCLGFACMGQSGSTGGNGDGEDAAPGGGGDGGGGGFPGDPAGTAVSAILTGEVVRMPGYEGTLIKGSGMLVRGATAPGDDVTLQVSGLRPSQLYMAHVHALPCASGGGGHYKLDPAVADTLEANEVWMQVMTDDTGSGRGAVTTAGHLRGDALSIVMHDPLAGTPPPKMACVDLKEPHVEPVAATGTFAPFAAAEALDNTITGSATLVRDMNGTIVNVNVTGLSPAAVYAAHVHALPCATTLAGGHYKKDPLILDPLETNELWPVIGNRPDGTVNNTVTIAQHVARADAQSIVIHRIVEGEPAPPPLKVACADLTPATHFDVESHGVARATPEGELRGMDHVFGSATMFRELSGITRVLLVVDRASPSTTYKVHVHDAPCIDGGGGHYKIDPTATEPSADNEIWLELSTDENGRAQSSVASGHIARPEARALVLHDASDNAKVACVDLE